MMKDKNVHWMILANLAVIGMAAVSLIGMNTIQAIYPLNNMVTDDRTPVFEWAGHKQSYELLIDDDPGFRTPLEFAVSGNTHQLRHELDFGTYWWKVRSGETETTARRFTVVSTVALARPGGTIAVNSGNADLLLHRSALAGAVTLAVNQSLEIGEEENVRAEQK